MQINEYYENLIFENGRKINYSRIISADFTDLIHWHPFVELLLCLENGNEVTINFNHYKVGINDLIILYPGDLHSIHNVSADSFLIVQFPLSLLSNIMETDSMLPTLSQCPVLKYNPKNAEYDKLILIFKNIFESNPQPAERPFQEIPTYIKLLHFFYLYGQIMLQSIPNEVESHNIAQYKSAKLMAEACLYISQNCSDALTLEGVAHHIGISKSYFSHLFKDYTKMTFVDFLTRERIKKSESLFLGSRKKIIDIAFECGFTSMSSFNRAFKKIKGLSPTEFRESLIENAN